MHNPNTPAPECLFLKLGGSLLTDKTRPEALRTELARALCRQIAHVWQAQPGLRLLLGIGSGSFGHVPARQYGLAPGVQHPDAWYGAALTADSAARLVRQVVAWLLELQLPAWSVQPSACWTTMNRTIVQGDGHRVVQALQRGLIPVVHGDVMLDTSQGIAIASTEEVFRCLVPYLRPSRILLAGEVPGVLRDPQQGLAAANVVPWIEMDDLAHLGMALGASRGIDVTGGMADKVKRCLAIVRDYPSTIVHIFDGRPAHALQRLMLDPDLAMGTRLVSRCL